MEDNWKTSRRPGPSRETKPGKPSNATKPTNAPQPTGVTKPSKPQSNGTREPQPSKLVHEMKEFV